MTHSTFASLADTFILSNIMTPDQARACRGMAGWLSRATQPDPVGYALAIEQAAAAMESMPRRAEKISGQSFQYVQLAEAIAVIRALLPPADRLAVVMAMPEVRAMQAALEAMLQSICGPTGFAEAVRHNSGRAYPWSSLDDAETAARAALTALVQP